MLEKQAQAFPTRVYFQAILTLLFIDEDFADFS
jgi:hypothetical protein